VVPEKVNGTFKINCHATSQLRFAVYTLACFVFSIGGGELFDRVIEDEFVLTEKACVCFMKQILDGVLFMHEKQVIHLDLKVTD
jgi:serine/threonine protein kinase